MNIKTSLSIANPNFVKQMNGFIVANDIILLPQVNITSVIITYIDRFIFKIRDNIPGLVCYWRRKS